MARLTQADLVDLNLAFEHHSPEVILAWAKDTFGDRVASISAMQEAGCVVCHMIHAAGGRIPVLFIDTGVNFQETLETRDRIAVEYGLEIVTLHPEVSMEKQTEQHGILYLTVEGQKHCCHMRKVEPLLKVADQYDAVIGSLRRAEGGKRSVCPVLEIDTEMKSVRINPLAAFTNEQLDTYIRDHKVITNPLHKQGFSTISCNRCTTPVLPNEPKRAGRWRHLGAWAADYCGINPTDRDPTHSPGIELPEDLIDRILGRKTDFMI